MTVEGFDDLQAALLSLGSVARQDGALKRAMTDALGPTAMLAIQMAPRRTGNLKRAIVISDTAEGSGFNIEGRGADETVTVYLGASYKAGARGRHAHLVEFGTVKSRPYPFLRPAWDQDRDAMVKRLAENLRVQITAAVKRKGKT